MTQDASGGAVPARRGLGRDSSLRNGCLWEGGEDLFIHHPSQSIIVFVVFHGISFSFMSLKLPENKVDSFWDASSKMELLG